MAYDISGPIKSSIVQKEGETEKKLTDNQLEKIKELEKAVDNLEDAYGNFRDLRNELDDYGIKFDDHRKRIKEHIDGMLSK